MTNVWVGDIKAEIEGSRTKVVLTSPHCDTRHDAQAWVQARVARLRAEGYEVQEDTYKPVRIQRSGVRHIKRRSMLL